MARSSIISIRTDRATTSRSGGLSQTWYSLTATLDGVKYGIEGLRFGDRVSIFEVYRQGGQAVRRNSGLRRELNAAARAYMEGL
jgi:hypothetical protein